MSQQVTIQTIIDHPIVPVFFHNNAEISLNVFKACYAGGMRVFEFTNRGANALQTFKLLQENLSNSEGYVLGAGTILSQNEAESFIEAGASFIVSPCFID
ncbi:MAG TPA: bifunctional 4-hydroxy-2-oxoglutarate aldolase/2-dehydro-3-deoxy-phosphogluconate aldolase, partial [Segetibacter sp.]